MTYYTFRFEGVCSDYMEYVDMDFSDTQPCSELRLWRMNFDRETGAFDGWLFLSENVEECGEEYRRADPEEIEDMWRVLPAEIKLKHSLYRKDA